MSVPSIDHWYYFLALDNDFGTLARYVEPCSTNLKTYSLEIARLLMTATQECDVILKQICVNIGHPAVSNEQAYRNVLPTTIPSITTLKILLPRFRLEYTPFENWQSNQTPPWWTANNKVKHNRNSQFLEAKLENVMFAISALYVANLYLYRDHKRIAILEPSPTYFIPALRSAGAKMQAMIRYKVPD